MTALLLSIGLLAVFALLRRGLDSRLEMEGETRGTLFANAAFNTLRAISEQAASSSSTNAWAAFWTDFGGGLTNIALVGGDVGQSPDTATDAGSQPALFGDGQVRTNRYFAFDMTGTTNGMPEASVLYQCTVVVTNTFEQWLSGYPTNRVEVTLHVWPRETPSGPAMTFFTLFSNPGRMP